MTECAHSGGVSSEFVGVGKGIVRRCVDCGEIVKDVDLPVPEQRQTASVPAAPPSKPGKKSTAAPRSKPVDVIKLAKQRLREVLRELKTMRRLEDEKAQLERLLNAADGKPAAVVRELRASSR
jgi:hypothetical protein